ncbi:midasin-like protein [Actinidia rufa]|uniref:Midasin n=1 Tax=Actinidia rufa TaxID=165716 RepID=A0A7J0FEQ4_9ERIC|nr:midasin-like protein [Actinidia rufa]
MAIYGTRLEFELARFLSRCPKLASVPRFNSLLKEGHSLTEEEAVNALGELFLHPNYTIPLFGCFRSIAQKIVEKAVALLRLVPDLRSGRTLVLHELACLAFSRALDLAPFLLGRSLSLIIVCACCLVEETEQSADFDPGENAELLKDVSDMRWCGIQILSVVLKISDRATTNFGLGPEEAFTCLLRWQEFSQDVSLEKAGWHLESFDHEKLGSVCGNIDFNHEYILRTSAPAFAALSSSKLHVIEPSSGNRSLATWSMTSTRPPFVLTSAMKKSFEMVLLAVSQKWPVLLYGPAGVGKTKLISELAWDSGSQVLSIHMDEQIDGKTLIGSYVCTENPGEFRWQPGSLTQAVLNGFWVVFEDIDNAPSDVQSILLPLLEGASSYSTGHGEAIRVADGFRLFSTISSSKLDISQATKGRNALGALWRRVMIGPPSDDDIDKHGESTETFEMVNQLSRFQFGISVSLSRFSLRDLIKWCKRVSAFGFSFSADSLSTDVCNCIYQEAVDIFASSTTSVNNRLNIMKGIAKLWAVPISAAETLYPVNKPVIQYHYERKNFVEIRSSIHVLERIACSVKFNEPVLLVGETGTGKTTLVQSLALRLGRKLTVLNLSQQSDVTDLLGGYKPMNAQFVCIPLYKEFENLFACTFPLKDNEDFLIRLKKYIHDKNWKMLLSGFHKEGAFVTALRNGEWILLDEVNLAPPETLQRVSGVLEEENGSLCLAERDLQNFVDDVLDDEDLLLFINQFMDDSHLDTELTKKIVKFYKIAKKESEERLQDGANQKPQYSLRSLYRALEYTKKARKEFGFQKALYDGFFRGDSRLDSLLENYVLTRCVKEHLRNLARAIFVGRYPVLLQGPTSSGKTSLVQYLAAITGHEFVRINNHEHTDLQEYLGSYITDASGRLTFHEGVLVKAVRKGNWIVLDELNLAPSDVLEALNRLLDDNRELFVPELRETVRAHPNFMLFATQNPPTFYGGRKMLSRAFRNRFVEIHVDEIPEVELTEILEKRCKIPESYARKMVEVMKELQLHRQSSKIFAGKHGFITPRDLFRWADRFREFGSSYEDLARDGYFLLAERLRDECEKTVVQEVLERQLRVKLSRVDLYKQDTAGRDKFLSLRKCSGMREPVLLVGETGGGKTTVCQLLSVVLGSKLHILNCHQYTETSDFLGGFYPVRERSRIASEFNNLCEQLILSKAFVHFPGAAKISADIGQAASITDHLAVIINSYKQAASEVANNFYVARWTARAQAMKNGDLLLVDEISLADDSVLERLNSVLEPERKLSLAEKGGSDLEKITAHPNFFLLATMNPGGDFGKKELSPALRNRFTEIWVPPVNDLNELRTIALQRISKPDQSYLVNPLLNFWEWFNELQTGRALTVRDLLSWIDFIIATEGTLQPEDAFLHGLSFVLLDGLSLGSGISRSYAGELRERCLSFLLEQLKTIFHVMIICNVTISLASILSYIAKGDDPFGIEQFEFLAPTTRRNVLRVLRALQLSKPVLLEGSPGVGKTSLIVALGKFSAHTVVRINLSEQTDIMDLLGSDLPVESDEGMQFAWHDGILLQALKNGSWVLLDELNLAPQSVLEGLNAILDHRAEGGGRKGLPKSFLNRFTKVYVDELTEDDYLFICRSLYPSILESLLSKLISFNKQLHEDTMVCHKFAQEGSPWEFNLRDVIRSCQIIQGTPEKSKNYCFLNAVYVQRMRTAADRRKVVDLYKKVFQLEPFLSPYPRVQLNPQYLVVGNTHIKRNHFQSTKTHLIVSLKSYREYVIAWRLLHFVCSMNGCVYWLVIPLLQPATGMFSEGIFEEKKGPNYPLALPSYQALVVLRQVLLHLLIIGGHGPLVHEEYRRRLCSAKFEWATGVLAKAIENGEWIVLENANLCNPTVLDRINSLVEPHGSITVNECGSVDGKPLVLHPHPQFRMFLTVDPSNGEVSRAMRNRGVEIYMMQPCWMLDGGICDESECEDVKRFLILSGIPIDAMVDSMTKAHNYAKVEGLRLDVKITYLELARWVQLFQRLLTNGNRPLWSLQISWEHTYLSSLGEAKGKEIVAHGIISYLSMDELYKFESSPGYSLCLPGGWPTPLKVRDYTWYSKETSVKQNCMHLEFLGAQNASYTLRSALDRSSVEQTRSLTGSIGPYLTDMKILHIMMFPNFAQEITAQYGWQTEIDLALVGKKLVFAANWTIEQATENDLELYLLWLNWVASRLQPVCNFFSSFLNLLKEELKHPIWNCILRCRHELLSHHDINLDSRPIPILSMELVDLFASIDVSKSSTDLLRKAIKCAGLLRISFQQWHAESKYEYSDKNQCCIPVLRSLRRVEEKILDILVESPSFKLLFHLYTDLIEDHTTFWKGITSSQFEMSLISWRSLRKCVTKLHKFCPKEVEDLQVEGKNLGRLSSWCLHSQKSLLWVHGGHPFLPPAADLYQKQQQLLSFCDMLWPRKPKSGRQAANDCLIEAAVSLNPELRFLAMQVHDDELHVVQQLEEMYQMLLRRFEHEKKKLEAVSVNPKSTSPVADLAACCIFSPDMLSRRSGFDSWQDTVPIIDNTSFFLDMELLQELSRIVLVDSEELRLVLSNLSDLLEPTLKFSLNLSSRSPTDFVPHQKFLWTLDAWTSVNTGNAKISSFVLEMWFNWHSSLWTIQPALVKNFSRMDGNEIPLPHMLFQPLRMATVDQILKSTSTIKDYPMHCLKSRVASSNLWHSHPSVTNVQTFLLSTARSLFQQIIYVHRKSFEADNFAVIESILCFFQKNMITEDNVKVLLSLLMSSGHHGLVSLVDSFIKPLLGELYLQCSSTELVYNLGCAWLRVGVIRYHLLITFDDLDPAMKVGVYFVLLRGVIILSWVRKESAYLAGCLSWREADKQRTKSLEYLKAECKRLKRKIVFRSDPGKFVKLKYECDEFLKVVTTANSLIKDADSMDKQEITNQVHNWQETATCFIDGLSKEYSAYVDIIQPVQIAIYEMKLGLSLLLSSALRKKILDRIGQDDMDIVLDTVYLFMRFPRGFAYEAVSVKMDCGLAKFPFCDIDFPIVGRLDMNLLENLVTSTADVNSDKMVSVLQLKVAMQSNFLLRVASSISQVQLMDVASFKLLDKIFDEFASLWLNMKVKAKTKKDHEAQQFKFKPRAFQIENIIEIDISTLVDSLPNEALSEWQDLLSEEVTEKKAEEEDDSLEEEWNLMQDSIMNNMVQTHNQLFGSMDLVKTPRIFKVSEAEWLSSFIDSYALGVRMVKGLDGLFSSNLDAKLAPEHLFRLSLEHDQKFNLSHQSAHSYNFYKDSNASVMAMMVERVTILRGRILFLLNEWDEHPALQKILDVIDMILAIPLSTPLAKALSGLQFLLNRIRVLQETVSKFPLSNELEPIFLLVSSWQKLEFESWPALLDEVQSQFEINARKLWFPLYSVLQNRDSADIAAYNTSIIQSLEEFIQTSSVGEFRKRLQLLFAFHGQFNAGICRGSYLSLFHMENVKILYNIFGFYVQYLPIILEHIEDKRKSIEMELKELLKLCRWEIPESCVSMENSKRTRQKLRKLVQKYSNHHKEGLKTQPVHQGPKLLTDSFDKNSEMLKVACDQTLFKDRDRSTWFIDWKKKVDYALQNLHLERKPEFEFSHFSVQDAEVFGSIISQCLASQSTCIAYQEASKQVWYTIENICRTAIDCTDIWKDENKSLGKRRALADLLKLLDSCGLSKHRSTLWEDPFKSNQSNWWLMQPSYDMKHLLLTHGGVSSRDPFESLDKEWETANQYYFRSMASVHLLRQICLNFHKDFTLEQVNRSNSFLDHLIVLQQEQRAAAYAFDTVTSKECSFAQNQYATFNCMWQQKQLFDGLCSMSLEESLLLKTVESNHLNNCKTVKDAANRVRVFIERFIPDFQKSKDLLDNFLLGHDRVVTSATASLHPCVISKQMEQLVLQNFQMIKEFENCLSTFRQQGEDRRSVKGVLLDHFEDILNKVSIVAENYKCEMQSGNDADDISSHTEKTSALESGFSEALKEAYKCIVDAFNRIDVIWDAVVKANNCAGKLVNHCGKGNASLCAAVGAHLKHLYSRLDLILTFSDNLLNDFLVVHKMVSVIAHVLANIFASLYSKGFGSGNEDPLEESNTDKTQDAKGTGMGEGAGVNDVSDQINDEDQLLGTSEKLDDEQAGLNEVPSKNDKGIEMEQDFAADTFSVSEESGDDNDEDGQDEQLDSAMGETGAESEIIDEKLWDKDDEEKPGSTKEKYESGPSVKDADSSGRELRAKEDSDSATPADEAGDLSPNEFDKEDDVNDSQDDLDNGENTEDMNMDKDEAFADSTGLKVDDRNQESEDVEMDEQEGTGTMEDTGSEGLDESDEIENGEEDSKSMDECPEEVEAEQVDGNRDDVGNNNEKDMEMDLEVPKNDVLDSSTSDITMDRAPNAESATQPKGDSQAADLRDVAPEAVEAKWSNTSDIQNDLAPTKGLHNASEIEITVPDSSNSGRISDNQPKSQLPQGDSSSSQKIEPNPCRNVGDALDEWKERVKVNVDLHDNNNDAPDDMLDENADEFGYTSEFDKGTAQALGPATSEQMDKNINVDKPEQDGKTMDREDLNEMQVEKQDSEMQPIRTLASNLTEKVKAEVEIQHLEKPPEEAQETHSHNERKSHNREEIFGDVKDNATVLWRRYELRTTRLSQELAEQLRLVMEPTLASKLQGDYKTGKRINMKKVIPYIASHYRKDKIWLRRTRPNKRDYQVVIAVDDSRSMSESHCGEVAIEALVTVCRAMSQLEVGNLAVASFGKKGNIRLLHEFDQPFTGEAGVKMISSLSFTQENTIADEPVVDLLRYVNNMLDVAVANARLPSGQNPLQQLVLIIADGRFHEKENLKRCVRDVLSKKRMVAFLLLDSPQESIMDLMEASFQGGNIKLMKYLDSFPFPYYIVLRNIEALPRTLADLLRQWFELMQYSRD